VLRPESSPVGADKPGKEGGVSRVKNFDARAIRFDGSKRVYTNLAVLDVIDNGFAVREMVPGMTLDELQKVTDAPLRMAM
jgi:3-oxoadipate CoA-transferase, beta subunit